MRTTGFTVRPLLFSLHLQPRSGFTPLQWVLHPGRPEWCDAAAPVWVRGGRAFKILYYWDVTQRDEMKRVTSPCVCLLYRLAVIAAKLLWICRACVSGSKVTNISVFSFWFHFLSLFPGINSVLCFFREYCKRLHISDNNTQFLQNFLSLMLDISPESDECEFVNRIFPIFQYLPQLQTDGWDNILAFLPQVTKASSTTWFWTLGLSDSWPPAFGRARIWIRESDKMQMNSNLRWWYQSQIKQLS